MTTIHYRTWRAGVPACVPTRRRPDRVTTEVGPDVTCGRCRRTEACRMGFYTGAHAEPQDTHCHEHPLGRGSVRWHDQWRPGQPIAQVQRASDGHGWCWRTADGRDGHAVTFELAKAGAEAALRESGRIS